MTESEFDQYAEEYYQMHATGIAKSGEKPEYFAEYKISDTRKVCDNTNCQANVILDFGSGIGNSIPYFRKYFPQANVICSDVSARSLEISAKRFPGKEEYLKINDDKIDLNEHSVDLIFTTCVFHHIPFESHGHWLTELVRVLKPNGLLIIFEHNPKNPLTVSTVKHCPFDVNARLLSASYLTSLMEQTKQVSILDISYRIFFPNALSFLRPIEKYLTKIPFGAQYYLVARKTFA